MVIATSWTLGLRRLNGAIPFGAIRAIPKPCVSDDSWTTNSEGNILCAPGVSVTDGGTTYVLRQMRIAHKFWGAILQ